MAVKKKTYDFRCRTLANVSGARRMRRPRSWRTEIARSGTAMSESRTDAYGYNTRNELISATKLGGPASVPTSPEYAYQYDDIGNRITSTDLATNRTYTANNLNQYTLISNLCDSASMREEFVPQFDDDGNQTLIQTSTGVWSVQYNGENRPVLWTGGTQSAATNIVMSFDRMGRRVEYRETAGGSQSSATETNAYHRFVYDNYLCIQRLDAANSNTVDLAFVWDVTEPIATRPLVFFQTNAPRLYFTHDGNKNVSDLLSICESIFIHYEYAPFGKVNDCQVIYSNPYRFSSEQEDINLSLICYNYRSYMPDHGRWSCRDLIKGVKNDYVICDNKILNTFDVLGCYYGNPVVNSDGDVIGPSSPYGGLAWSKGIEKVHVEDSLETDRRKLFRDLLSLCPAITEERMTSWGSCCNSFNCFIQARLIADSVYNKVAYMRNKALFSGWFGNLMSWSKLSYGCVAWETNIVDVIKTTMDSVDGACFKAVGVGSFWFGDYTKHNWVKIFGPKVKGITSYTIKNTNECVEIDPWHSGGKRLFPDSFQDVEGVTYWGNGK